MGYFDRPHERIHGRQFTELMLEIGNLNFAWNALHADLADLFTYTTGLDYFVARAIWNSIRSDSAQRGMLLAASNISLKDDSCLADVQWLLNEVAAIHQYRNDVAHVHWSALMPPGLEIARAPWKAFEHRILADPTRGNPRANRLADRDVIVLFHQAANYCMELVQYSRYCAEFARCAREGEQQPPSTRRPEMPSCLKI